MGIPNATGEQLASQARIQARAQALLEQHHGVEGLLARRPDLAGLPLRALNIRDLSKAAA